jgi:hypothetical protein
MALYDAFFGSDQSLYTAYAIMAAIIAICITILLTSTDISIGNRILIVLFVIITLVPSIFLTLFEITCMVTGGTEPNRWWCYAFAWILAAFVIIYCVFVVIISLISLFTYNNVIDNVNEIEKKNKLSETATNNIAKEIINSDEEKKKMENFYLMPDENEQFRDLRKEKQFRPIPRTIPQDPLSLVKPQDLAGGCLQNDNPACSHENDILNDVKCCYKWFGSHKKPVKKIELFGAEPMDELTPPPVPIPPQDENKGNLNIQSNNESFTNNEGFETYYNNNKKYFSNFSPSGISNTLHDIKNAIPFPTFATF